MILRNARVMTCTGEGLGLIDRGAIVIQDGVIVWVGDDAQAPSADDAIDCGGQLVTPGLVDCHTHAIFAGNRANEFAMRARKATYRDIAKAGGGIAATVRATTEAPGKAADALSARIAMAREHGTTTIEVKSGYGLSMQAELDLLAVIHACSLIDRRTRVAPTLLAHAVPAERADDRARYVTEWCELIVPGAARAKHATSVDVYCDDGAFTLDEARAIWEAAKRVGLAVRGHVGQFADLGGAEALAALGALSADHLEHVSDGGVAALAGAGTVAVMLPGACVQLRMWPPPVETLRTAGVALAVATDLNPGTSYCEALPIQMWLACTHYGMTVDEAWLGVTRIAARALGLEQRGIGTIARGAPADLVTWRATDPAEIPYRYGTSLVDTVICAGLTI